MFRLVSHLTIFLLQIHLVNCKLKQIIWGRIWLEKPVILAIRLGGDLPYTEVCETHTHTDRLVFPVYYSFHVMTMTNVSTSQFLMSGLWQKKPSDNTGYRVMLMFQIYARIVSKDRLETNQEWCDSEWIVNELLLNNNKGRLMKRVIIIPYSHKLTS